MTKLTRRRFVEAATILSLTAFVPKTLAASQGAMARAILDNDFSGDPDGLFQLAHHVLSSSIDVPLIIGTHLPADLPWVTSEHQATDAAAKVHELLEVMNMEGDYTVIAGSETAIPSRSDWKPSPATAAIVQEAMRNDTKDQLVYAAGAGLTELALAWLAEPRIGSRVRLIWIGGGEHTDLAYAPPGREEIEFNFTIDPIAAQIIFNESDIEIWQIPRNVYRQLLVSNAELRELAETGPLGRYLKTEIDRVFTELSQAPEAFRPPRSETYILGDSPLVTLTALQSPIMPDPSSSSYRVMPTPHLSARGEYGQNPDGRPMRVYTSIDTRLTFRDMLVKFRAADSGRITSGAPTP